MYGVGTQDFEDGRILIALVLVVRSGAYTHTHTHTQMQRGE